MPPRVRFDKQAIVQAGLNVARRGGMEALNARAIARELGSSTQPLYRELSNMEELRGEVRAEAGALFGRRLAEWRTGKCRLTKRWAWRSCALPMRKRRCTGCCSCATAAARRIRSRSSHAASRA